MCKCQNLPFGTKGEFVKFVNLSLTTSATLELLPRGGVSDVEREQSTSLA